MGNFSVYVLTVVTSKVKEDMGYVVSHILSRALEDGVDVSIRFLESH